MSVERLDQIPGFSIDRVAAAAGDDPDVLRLENLDTDIPPPADGASRRPSGGGYRRRQQLAAVHRPGRSQARRARRRSSAAAARATTAAREIVITSGEGDAMLDALFCLTDPGDEVVLTDPTYAGMLNRVRLAGATPRLVPLRVAGRRVAARSRRASLPR